MDKGTAARIISKYTGLSPSTIEKTMKQTFPVFLMTDNGVYQYRFENKHSSVWLDVTEGNYRLQLVKIFWNRQRKTCSEADFKHLLQERYGIPTKGKNLVCHNRDGVKVYEIMSDDTYAEIFYKEGVEFTTRLCRVYHGVVSS